MTDELYIGLTQAISAARIAVNQLASDVAEDEIDSLVKIRLKTTTVLQAVANVEKAMATADPKGTVDSTDVYSNQSQLLARCDSIEKRLDQLQQMVANQRSNIVAASVGTIEPSQSPKLKFCVRAMAATVFCGLGVCAQWFFPQFAEQAIQIVKLLAR